MPMPLTVSPASATEFDLMTDWAAAEGWNPALADAAPFLAADPDGFLVGRLGSEPVACISVVDYGPGFGFLGFYICRPDMRGRGYGKATWDAGMRKLGDRVVGLDGVLDQQENYRKSGFALAHRNIRYGGLAAGRAVTPPVTPVSGRLVEAVVAYDRPFFAGPREAFLRKWLEPDRRTALAYVEDGRVRGYGVIRRCRTGHKIGPLFADTETIAEALFDALAGTIAGQPVFVDPPEPNAAAVRLAERHGLTPVFETARMYRGTAPDLPLDRTYGITTFELG